MPPGDVVTVADQIEGFIRTHFRVAADDARLTSQCRLFDLGYVDSVGVVELTTFMNKRFGVRVPVDTLLSDEFATIDGMAAIVARLQADDAPIA